MHAGLCIGQTFSGDLDQVPDVGQAWVPARVTWGLTDWCVGVISGPGETSAASVGRCGLLWNL